MIKQNEFLEKFDISADDFEKTILSWDELVKIYNDYLKYRDEIEPSATYIFTTLMKASKVHSVRYRIKDPEHVIEKIIRKKILNNDFNIHLENYKSVLTDLIGFRALHLFKDDWNGIDGFIRKTWNLKELPVANYRRGDSEDLINIFKEKGCEVKEHKYGYRSIHYVIETQPGIQKHFAEIQVRTIFEEAWSEIDHTVRYPYDLDNPIFSQFLLILNRLAGGADEMGSFIKFLQNDMSEREKEFSAQIDEKQKIISDLEQKMDKMNLQSEELASVKQDLEKLRVNQHPQYSSSNNYLGESFKIPAGDLWLKSIRESQQVVEGLKSSTELMKSMTQHREVIEGLKVSKTLFQAMNELKGL